jgi:phage gpG-like protein
MSDIDALLRKIIKDIRVNTADEFDKNFQRQSFFGEAWKRRKSPVGGQSILIRSGSLRRSITATIDDTSVTFSSSEPYAAIHNEGGKIVVTAKMKKFFWRKYYETVGSFGRKKDKTMRKDKRNVRLSTIAEFWKAMALMKVGSTITIPKRRFIGTHPKLEEQVKAIITENIEEFLKNEIPKMIVK